MLTELCQELRNWFDLDRREGTFTISGGALAADFLVTNQYYRIIGSVFSDGVHQFGKEKQGELKDETFTGSVWALAIPKEVVDLSAKIEAWRGIYENADSAALSPYSSESFAGYSYTKSSGGSGANAAGSTTPSWKSVFKPQLNMWRKILP